MADEQFLVLIGPKGVAKGITGNLIQGCIERGLKIDHMRQLRVSKVLAEEHYCNMSKSWVDWTDNLIRTGIRDLVGSSDCDYSVAIVFRGDQRVGAALINKFDLSYIDGIGHIRSSSKKARKREVDLWLPHILGNADVLDTGKEPADTIITGVVFDPVSGHLIPTQPVDAIVTTEKTPSEAAITTVKTVVQTETTEDLPSAVSYIRVKSGFDTIEVYTVDGEHTAYLESDGVIRRFN